jgi:hypothetical protein
MLFIRHFWSIGKPQAHKAFPAASGWLGQQRKLMSHSRPQVTVGDRSKIRNRRHERETYMTFSITLSEFGGDCHEVENQGSDLPCLLQKVCNAIGKACLL